MAAQGIEALRGETEVDERRQVIDVGFDGAHHSTYDLSDMGAEFVEVPLALHASYLREEILAGLGCVPEADTRHAGGGGVVPGY